MFQKVLINAKIKVLTETELKPLEQSSAQTQILLVNDETYKPAYATSHQNLR